MTGVPCRCIDSRSTGTVPTFGNAVCVSREMFRGFESRRISRDVDLVICHPRAEKIGACYLHQISYSFRTVPVTPPDFLTKNRTMSVHRSKHGRNTLLARRARTTPQHAVPYQGTRPHYPTWIQGKMYQHQDSRPRRAWAADGSGAALSILRPQHPLHCSLACGCLRHVMARERGWASCCCGSLMRACLRSASIDRWTTCSHNVA